MAIFELLVFGIFMCIAFRLGMMVNKPEKQKYKPIINLKKVKKQEYEDLDEASMIMLENIDNYDGTGINQKDVPEDRKDW